ncbi:hypothetical protein VTO73DRAFT_1503 [Trametes versicolor]
MSRSWLERWVRAHLTRRGQVNAVPFQIRLWEQAYLEISTFIDRFTLRARLNDYFVAPRYSGAPQRRIAHALRRTAGLREGYARPGTPVARPG